MGGSTPDSGEWVGSGGAHAADSGTLARGGGFVAQRGGTLRLLHTADWHIGKRFPAFSTEDERTLMRARVEVVGRILHLARQHAVDAVLCAGDLFDDPWPDEDFQVGLARVFREHAPSAPVFLVPGNHDPLTPDSVWAPGRTFRAGLPSGVHVVDRDDFSFDLSPEAVLHARPCRSRAGHEDLALALPRREPQDARLRIGCVHGTTFDLPGFQTNFPIARTAAVDRGFDYLAIGDTHAFRDVTPDLAVPTVYPGSPEPGSFDEHGAGNVAIVELTRPGFRARVTPEPVGRWAWEHITCRDLSELRGLLAREGLERRVLRVELEMTVTPGEERELNRILRLLAGTDATRGRAGAVVVERARLRRRVAPGEFGGELPPLLLDVVARLERRAADGDDAERARAALANLRVLVDAGSDG